VTFTGDRTKIAMLLLTLLVGGGAKIGSLDALFRIRDAERMERVVARVEADALRLALALRASGLAGDASAQAAVLAERFADLDTEAVLAQLGDDPIVQVTMSQLGGIASAQALAALAVDVARAPQEAATRQAVDGLALIAGAAAESVHSASAARVKGLWQRVLTLGGGAVVAFLISSLGGSTLAARASNRLSGVMGRIDEYARRLRQADAERVQAVAEAELAAIARTEARTAEALGTLNEALELAQRGAAKQADTAASLASTRRMLETLSAHIAAPLDGIRDLAATLTVGSKVTQAQRQRIESLELSGDALEQLAAIALDLVRLEQGDEALALRPFRPEMLAGKARAAVAAQAQRNGVTVTLDYADGSIESRNGDIARIEQLLITLLRDAVAATAKGQVTLRLEDGAGDMLLLHVEESGGAGDADSAFNEETLAERPARAVAKALADHLGGHLSAAPASGKRVCVTLALPLPATSADRAMAEAP
jgi:signal transduction histidine kinase